MISSDLQAGFYSRVFKGLLLSEDVARMEEQGELLRPESATAQPLFGNFEGYFSPDLRERAQKMTYAYCLFYCFENEVRVLVAQRQATIGADINHTLFGDLSSIIISQWQEFEELFPDQRWMQVRLNELERSRNVIAHGNELPDSEIERLEQYLSDRVRQVP